MNEVSEMIDELEAMNYQIASAAEQQSSCSQEINTNVGRVRDLSKQILHSTQGIQDSSLGLEHISSDIRQHLQQFRFDPLSKTLNLYPRCWQPELSIALPVVYNVLMLHLTSISQDKRSMITLHHLENSRSQRILWLLEELGVEYEIKRYERDPKTNLAPDSLKAIHPLGKSPLITDGGKTIAESAVIISYLIRTYGKDSGLIPDAGSKAEDQADYRLHFAEGS